MELCSAAEKQPQYVTLNWSSLASISTSSLYILAIEAFVLALHNIQSIIYTSSKGRKATYSSLAYSDKQLSIHVLVVVVIVRAKLKQSQLFVLGGIYGIEWCIAKLKLSNELEHEGIYLLNAVC